MDLAATPKSTASGVPKTTPKMIDSADIMKALRIRNSKTQLVTDVTVKGKLNNPQVRVICDPVSYSAVEAFLLEHYSCLGLLDGKKPRAAKSHIATTTVAVALTEKASYTINMYPTTHSMLVNGRGATSSFVEHLRLAATSIALATEADLKPMTPDSGTSRTPPAKEIVHNMDTQPGLEENLPCAGCAQVSSQLRLALQRLDELETTVKNLTVRCDTAELRLHQYEQRPTAANMSIPVSDSGSYVDVAKQLPTVRASQASPVKTKPTQRETAKRNQRRPTAEADTWAPERCFMITEYNDKQDARTLAGVRAAISKHLPQLRVEAVHRPRSGKLIVQLESAEAVDTACDTWNTEILGQSAARRLESKMTPVT